MGIETLHRNPQKSHFNGIPHDICSILQGSTAFLVVVLHRTARVQAAQEQRHPRVSQQQAAQLLQMASQLLNSDNYEEM